MLIKVRILFLVIVFSLIFDLSFAADTTVSTALTSASDEIIMGSNDTVTIKHVITGKTENMKFKKAEPLLKKGEYVLKDMENGKQRLLKIKNIEKEINNFLNLSS